MTRVAKVCARGGNVQCMTKAWKMQCGEKYVNYTTNNPNMFLMRKHDKSQSLVLIGVQTSEKMPKRHFTKHLVCTLWTTMWNNAWTSWNPPLIHVLFAIRGQHQKKINKRNQSHAKIWQKLSFPSPYDENPNQEYKNSPKHNLRIKINGKEFIITFEMLMEWKTIQIDWVLM